MHHRSFEIRLLRFHFPAEFGRALSQIGPSYAYLDHGMELWLCLSLIFTSMFCMLKAANLLLSDLFLEPPMRRVAMMGKEW